MKLSLNWLKEYVGIEAAGERTCRTPEMLGLEVEDVRDLRRTYKGSS